MKQDPKEIEEIIEFNQKQASNFEVWPIIFFFLGLIIAALAFRHTF